MKKKTFVWNVMNWSFNQDKLETYDVGPSFVSFYKSLKPKARPKTYDEIEKWLDSEARYHFWAKCEYEMIVHGWPAGKNDEKIDIYDQLKLNWNVFVNKFAEFVAK